MTRQYYVSVQPFPGILYPVELSNNRIVMGASDNSVGAPANAAPIVFTYAAWDSLGVDSGVATDVVIFDSGLNVISTINMKVASGRYELKIIGGTPTLYRDGSGNRNQCRCYSKPFIHPLGYLPQSDNIVIGDIDHHVVGALPSNWTIQEIGRIRLPPVSYAWNNATQTWVLKNSYTFYIDADW